MKKKYRDEFFTPPEADEFLDSVKNEFSKSFEVEDKFLSAWLSHHGESQGKWLRARLALATGGLLGLSSQTAINWAVVCELIHSASLLHDDICDEDSLRRGQSSLWKEYGISAAICTGDYLIAESFRKITEIEQGWHQTILLKLLSCSVKEIIFGQSKDVSLNPFSINWQQYEKIAIDKTAPFIALPMMGMFKCKECSSDECDGLQLASNYLGLCYQYLNDVENLIGINQVMFTDIYKGHPNGMLIKILDELDQENKLKVQKNPKLLINFIDKKLFLEQEKIIKSFLKIAENEFHRVPKVVQPVLISIKNEVRGRLENMMSKIL
jgi:geranylgeranyl diphosphate synthase type I|tara:strand:+ start:826 stop:1797 length:972 start_codon:yes stop_codon:yes gene_type:complete